MTQPPPWAAQPTPPPSPPPNADDWLMTGGVKSASFDGTPPITWAGEVTEKPSLIQKRDFDTGAPLFWDDQRPKMLMQVNIQTEVRDAGDPHDDGVRALYLEYKKANAVRDALKAAGVRGIEPGGHLSLTYTHDGPQKPGSRGKPPKEYTATYTVPDQFASVPGVAQDPWTVDKVPAAVPPPVPPGAGWGQQQQIPAAQAVPPVTATAQGPPSSPATPPAALDPQLVEFLEKRGIQTAGMDQNTAEMIARSLPK